MPSKSLADLRLVQFHETDKAYLVGETEDREKAIWVPKSEVERYDQVGSAGRYDIYDFTMPEWLAKEKELI